MRFMLLSGSKPGAFVKPSPTFPTFSAATLSPTYGPLPLFYPFFLPVSSFISVLIFLSVEFDFYPIELRFTLIFC